MEESEVPKVAMGNGPPRLCMSRLAQTDPEVFELGFKKIFSPQTLTRLLSYTVDLSQFVRTEMKLSFWLSYHSLTHSPPNSAVDSLTSTGELLRRRPSFLSAYT